MDPAGTPANQLFDDRLPSGSRLAPNPPQERPRGSPDIPQMQNWPKLHPKTIQYLTKLMENNDSNVGWNKNFLGLPWQSSAGKIRQHAVSELAANSGKHPVTRLAAETGQHFFKGLAPNNPAPFHQDLI